MGQLRQRLRFALRSLSRRPVQAVVVVALLAIGFAAAGSVLTFLRGAVLSPFPYAEPERIHYLYTSEPRSEGGATERWSWWSGPDFLELKRQARSFEALGLFSGGSFNWTGPGFAERVRGLVVTPGYFDVFAVAPIMGRTFTGDDLRQQRDLAVISRTFWERQLDADPDVLGRTLDLNGHERVVVGVMPERFRHIGAHVWTLTRTDLAALDRDRRGLFVMGRLKPGVTAVQADAELEGLRAAMAEAYGGSHPEYRDVAFLLNPLADIIERAGPTIALLAGGVMLLLVLTWLNVGHVLMARGMERRRDLAVRMACGAKRSGVTADLLVETLVLFLPAVALGLAGAVLALDWLVALVPPRPEGLEYIAPEARIAVDPIIFVALVALSLIGVLAAGLYPAIRASSVRLGEALKEGARDTGDASGRGNWTTAAQFALAAVLLSGAALLLQTLSSLRQVDLGFRSEGVVTFQVTLPSSRYDTPEAEAGFYRELVERLRSRAEITSAGASHLVPLQGFEMRTPVTIRGQAERNDGRPIAMLFEQITPDYRETLDIPLLQGREFGAADDRTAPPVALVNRAFVERYYPEGAVLGEMLRLGDDEQPWRRIVGVLGDVRQFDIERTPEPAVYVPHAQADDPRGWMVVSVTPASPGADPAPLIRETVRALDPELPAFMVQGLDDVVASALGVRHLAAVLATGFAVTAFLVAMLGIFGVMSQQVARRRRELGLRGALGATRWRLRRMVLGRALALAGAGAATGLVAAVLLHRWLETLLYGVGAADPVTYGATAAALIAAGLLAAAVPAWRASAIPPARALREE